MERLTIRNSDGSVSQPMDLRWADALYRLAAYEDTGLEPAEIEIANKVIVSAFNLVAKSGTDMLIERLKEIICAKAEGRLQVLPCKVGDKVYQTDGIKVYESTVRQLIFDTENIAFDICAIGKSVFRTREEAEAKLEEMDK